MKLFNVFFILITISQVSYANIDRSIFRKDTVIIKRYEMMGDLTSDPILSQVFKLHIVGDSFIIKSANMQYKSPVEQPPGVRNSGIRIDSISIIDNKSLKYVYTTIYNWTSDKSYNTEKSKITNELVYEYNFFVFNFFSLDDDRDPRSVYPELYDHYKRMLANFNYIPFFPNDKQILYYKNSHIISPFVDFVYQGDTLLAAVYEFSHSKFLTEDFEYYFKLSDSLGNFIQDDRINYGISYMTTGIVFLEYNSGLPIFLLAKNIERSGISGFEENYIVYKIDDLVIPDFSIEDLIQEIPLDMNIEFNK